jgi:hypothetical protein
MGGTKYRVDLIARQLKNTRMELAMTMQSPAYGFENRAERRSNLLLRNRFETAAGLFKPLMGHPEARNGTGLYRAMSQLQATCPDLNGNEIEALVATVMQVLQTRQARCLSQNQ